MGNVGSDENNLAFKEMFDRHHGRLLRSARKILDDDHDAQEVVQETFSQVWKRISDVELKHLYRYLFRALRLNALKRRARRRRNCSLEDVAELADDAESIGGQKNISGHWLQEIDPFTLEEGLAGLPETQQGVLRMKYYMDLTFNEIGQTLKISSNTAASRCRYGLENLRKILINYRGDK